MKLYSVTEAAGLMGLSRATVYRLVSEQAIPVTIVRGTRKITEKSIREYIAANTIEAI